MSQCTSYRGIIRSSSTGGQQQQQQRGQRHYDLGARRLLFGLTTFLVVASCGPLQQSIVSGWADCPVACRCRWTSGKKSALCPDGGLDALPNGLDPDTQVIDLRGNRIPELSSEAFKNVGLLNLQKVYLGNAGISRIHGHAFRDMGILVELDLSNNRLTELATGTFRDNGRLKLLVLSGNPLRILRDNQFPSLSHLKTLELQSCLLREVQRLAFHNLSALETLRLDNNELEYLQASSITSLRNLKTLGLDGNPWRCDCRMRDFVRLITAGNRLYAVPQKCSSPEWLRTRSWEDVRTSEFACEPTIKLPVRKIQEEINGNVSLSCLASGDPEPEVWWQLNGGPVNGTYRHRIMDDYYGTPGGIVVYSTSLETHQRYVERWSNLTIYNASDADAGDYTCHARNTAGTAKETVQVRIPRVSLSSPTLSQTDNWLLWVSLAGGSTLALCASALVGLIALCICGGARRRHRRAKVKLQASASFGDQEKKLLDLSVTTTATTTTSSSTSSSQHHLQSHQLHQSENCQQMPSPPAPIHANDLNHCHQPDFELDFDSCSVQEYINAQSAASVTVERLRRQHSADSPQPALYCPLAMARAARTLSPALQGNIFIAVSLPSQDCQQYQRPSPSLSPSPSYQQHHPPPTTTTNYEPMVIMTTTGSTTTTSTAMATTAAHERCYPDLLDIGFSSYATLPRRGRSRELGSPYDSMGPRVTATGSSTFSLVEQPEELEPPLLANGSLGGIVAQVPLIQPPPEFVSL